jgi:hypothetical protein
MGLHGSVALEHVRTREGSRAEFRVSSCELRVKDVRSRSFTRNSFLASSCRLLLLGHKKTGRGSGPQSLFRLAEGMLLRPVRVAAKTVGMNPTARQPQVRLTRFYGANRAVVRYALMIYGRSENGKRQIQGF